MTPEDGYNMRGRGSYYVIGVDVGRQKCNSEAVVIKVMPKAQGESLKYIVNNFSLNDATMEEQALWIKKMYYQYKARTVVVDANGLGIGLVDSLVVPTMDPETGDVFPPFGVEGGTFEDVQQQYKRFRTSDMEKDALYLMKANLPINSEGYSYLRTQLNSNKLRFLIDYQEAKTRLLQTKKGLAMNADEKNRELFPFEQTDVLKDQLLNMVIQDNTTGNVILKQASRSIPKDKVSALMYGLYYIKQEESKKKKRSRDMSSLLLFTQS